MSIYTNFDIKSGNDLIINEIINLINYFFREDISEINK